VAVLTVDEPHPERFPETVYTVVLVGFIVILAEVAPVFQVYVVTPDADNVADEPAHIEVELTVITGELATIILAVAVLTQPPADVPVTVYEVLDVGLAVKLAVVAPVFQVYVLAPVALNVAVEPAQIVVELTAVVGKELTVTLTILVLLQPEVVPVTV
jgi:hypothetical protein